MRSTQINNAAQMELFEEIVTEKTFYFSSHFYFDVCTYLHIFLAVN